MVNNIFKQKTTEMHAEMSEKDVVNDDANFAPCLLWSFCEIVNDCFGASAFLFESSTPSEKYLGLNQSPAIFHNDLNKDSERSFMVSK